MEKGLVHLYCGTGKGKTTSGMGLAIRMLGNGKKVLIAQFLKDYSSNEIKFLEKQENVTLLITQKVKGFYYLMSEEDKKTTIHLQNDLLGKISEQVLKEEYGLLIMDEIVDAVNAGIIETSKVIEFLKNRPSSLEVVMSGRNPNSLIVEASDYYTDFVAIKHPYEKGIPARKGVEY